MKTLIMRYSFGLLLMTKAKFGYSQPPTDSANPNEATFINTVREAKFPGGSKALTEYLRRNVRYPEAAKQASIEGKVLMSFVIDTLGAISNIKVLKGLGYGCDEEASRVIKAMPRWQPSLHLGRVHPARYMLPVPFVPNP